MKNDTKSLKLSQRITDIYLLIVLIGVPLVVHQVYADIGKTKYYFFCGACVLLIPILFLKLKAGCSIPKFLKSLSTGEKALLIYWAVSALSTLCSPYRFEAFWGNEGRLCGLMLISVYLAAYFLVTRSYQPRPVIVYACIGTGVLVFLLGITDFFDLNLLHFKDNIVQESYTDFTSTIGNINFYAAYGAVITGLVAGLYSACYSLWGSALYFLLLLICFSGLIVGGSDNAYLTFAVLAAFLPLDLFRSRRGVRKYFMILSALLGAFLFVKLCSIFFAGMVLELDGLPSIITHWRGFPYLCLAVWAVTALLHVRWQGKPDETDRLGGLWRFLWGLFLCAAAAAVIAVLIDANVMGHAERYHSIRKYVVFENDWGTRRGFAWYKAIQNYRKFPPLQKILGYGPETYGIVFYFQNFSESVELYQSFFDNVHNEYLQLFVTVGPIATAAYLVFLALSIRDMLRCHASPCAVGAAWAVFCYCGQAVVNINETVSASILWMVLAIGIAECRSQGGPPRSQAPPH